MKNCIHCGIKKPLKEYPKDPKRLDGHRSECKPCHNIRDKQNARKRKYGVTHEQFLNLRKFQKNKCAICFSILKDGIYQHLDHCHKTKKVRGILCNNCNRGIGYLKDSTQTLKSAILYLDKHANKDTK
jgi:hypothetical protein